MCVEKKQMTIMSYRYSGKTFLASRVVLTPQRPIFRMVKSLNMSWL